MWRPATRALSGTNDVPLANKRRFGLPEEAPPPPSAPPPNYARPPASDIEFFNGRIERDRKNEPEPRREDVPPPPPAAARESRWDERRDDHRDDRRDDRDRRGDEHDRRRDDYRRDDRGYDRDRERDMGRDRERDRERRYDDDRGRESRDGPPGPPAAEGELDRTQTHRPSLTKDLSRLATVLPTTSFPLHRNDPAPSPYSSPSSSASEPRKRKSRWGDASQKVEVPGLPVAVMGNVSQTELDNYAIHIRLEEIARKLRTGDVIPPPGQRSPSPPPDYDAYGRRTNTLDIRYRKKLEEERTRLIDRAMKADPNFRPPADMSYGRRSQKPQDKVYIPVKEFPEINFFGLLVGPRGNSLKRMERESGAKISIRGKGSVKDGKGREGRFPEDEEDELHCLITGDHEFQVKACVELINKVIETAASTPEGQNDHKRNQLRELASLNGTLRDDENQLCQNCGEKGHRRWECPQQRVYSANVICRLCGGAGHMARDCRGRGDPNLSQNKQTAFDSEYSALMAELGEGGGAGGATSGRPAGAINQPPQENIPPWRIPENWQGGGFRGPPMGGHGGPGGPPQQGYGGPMQHQNQGYGYGGGGGGGGDGGYRGGGGMGGPQRGPGGPGGPGGQDPYASYYAGMGQAA